MGNGSGTSAAVVCIAIISTVPIGVLSVERSQDDLKYCLVRVRQAESLVRARNAEEVVGTASALTIAQSSAFLTPRSELDIGALVREALAHIERERPEVDSRNLSFASLDYGYQPMPSTRSRCGPNGCVEFPRPPFSERVYVAFLLLDSKKQADEMIEFEGLGVQFPSYDIPQISIHPVSSKGSFEHSPFPVALPDQDLRRVVPINASNMLAVAMAEARRQRPDLGPNDLGSLSLHYHFDYSPDTEIHMNENGTPRIIVRRQHREDITASLELLPSERDASADGRPARQRDVLNVIFPNACRTNLICVPGGVSTYTRSEPEPAYPKHD